jgi:prepilin-type N-terminal cleavage/methylation domain-containing protein
MKIIKYKGFTLVELLVVMGVIAVLSGVLVLLINPVLQLQKSSDAKRKSDLRQIQSALELYRADQLAYPGALSCGSALTGVVNGATVTYIAKVPCDPKTGLSYSYTAGSPASSYTIKACLENSKDPDQDAKQPGGHNSCVLPYYSYTLLSP